MTDQLTAAVKRAAVADDVAALRELVAIHGGSTLRLDGDPTELTALHWAAASGNVRGSKIPVESACGSRSAGRQEQQLHATALSRHAGACSSV